MLSRTHKNTRKREFPSSRGLRVPVFPLEDCATLCSIGGDSSVNSQSLLFLEGRSGTNLRPRWTVQLSARSQTHFLHLRQVIGESKCPAGLGVFPFYSGVPVKSSERHAWQKRMPAALAPSRSSLWASIRFKSVYHFQGLIV